MSQLASSQLPALRLWHCDSSHLHSFTSSSNVLQHASRNSTLYPCKNATTRGTETRGKAISAAAALAKAGGNLKETRCGCQDSSHGSALLMATALLPLRTSAEDPCTSAAPQAGLYLHLVGARGRPPRPPRTPGDAVSREKHRRVADLRSKIEASVRQNSVAQSSEPTEDDWGMELAPRSYSVPVRVGLQL